MKAWRAPLCVAALLAVVAHLGFVLAYPSLLMHITMQRLAGGDARLHRWLHAAPVTPASRGIVRPGPEFAYSACVYDLSRGPLHIRLPASRDYWSLSLYAANTDNFLTERDVEHREGLDLILAYGATAPAGAVLAPSARGIALIRRLASDAARWTEVKTLRKEDVCELAEP